MHSPLTMLGRGDLPRVCRVLRALNGCLSPHTEEMEKGLREAEFHGWWLAVVIPWHG